ADYPGRRGLTGGDAGGDSHAVVRRATDGQPRYGVDRLANPPDPLEMSHGVLRKSPTPPGHLRVDRPGMQTDRISQIHEGGLNEVAVIALEMSLIAVAADRAPGDHVVGRMPAPF